MAKETQKPIPGGMTDKMPADMPMKTGTHMTPGGGRKGGKKGGKKGSST